MAGIPQLRAAQPIHACKTGIWSISLWPAFSIWAPTRHLVTNTHICSRNSGTTTGLPSPTEAAQTPRGVACSLVHACMCPACLLGQALLPRALGLRQVSYRRQRLPRTPRGLGTACSPDCVPCSPAGAVLLLGLPATAQTAQVHACTLPVLMRLPPHVA